MSENKFIQHLKGKDTAKSVLEIKNQVTPTTFANMPAGTSDGSVVYSDHRGNATVVANGTVNWKLNTTTLVPATTVSGNGDDFVSTMSVAGAGLWINAIYTFPTTGDPAHPVSMIFNPQTKWVLKLCGDNLLVENGNSVELTLTITIGSSNIITKSFVLTEQANQFCKELVIDFAESNTDIIKALGNSTMRVQVLCATAGASARIYNGMTVLTLLQRKVEATAVASTFANVDDFMHSYIIPTEYFSNQDYIVQVADGDTAYAVFQRDGDVMNFVGWHQPIPDQTGNSGKFLTTDGDVLSWEQLTISNIDGLQTELDDLQNQIDDVSGRGRFLSIWNCATGLAETNPPESPYTYKAGDYFIVGVVSSATPAVNYKPNGATYTTGVASTTVESSEVNIDDTYIYDGTTWKLQANSQRTYTFAGIAGSPYDNANLSTALNSKQDTLVNQTNIKSVNGNSLLGSGNLELSTYLTYPAGWTTNSTTKAFCDDIAADNSAVKGKAYLGEVTFSDLPESMANAEVVAKIMDGTTAANKVIVLTCTSGNVSPYMWIYTYWNGGSNVSGWQTWATAAQGAKADTAVQPADLASYVTTSTQQDITGIKTFKAELLSWNNITFESAQPNPIIRGMSGASHRNMIARTNSTSAIDVGNTSDTINLKGSGTRPTYNSNDLAMYSDVPSLTGYIQNTATGTDSLTILGTAATSTNSVNIGTGAGASGIKAVSVGDYASAEGEGSIAIGGDSSTIYRARATHKGNIAIGHDAYAINDTGIISIGETAHAQGKNTIQLGTGTNNTQNTFQVRSYTLLDTSTGLIPDARISSNIARTSALPSDFTGATAGDVGTNGLVPAPAAGDQAKFLQGDGTWANPTAATAWGNITGTLSDQIDLQNALSNKADTDFGNTSMIDYVIEKQDPNAVNGYTWYRKYKSGWVEQGGNATNQKPATVTLPVEMADTNFTLVAIGFLQSRTNTNGARWSDVSAWISSTTTITLGGSTLGMCWQVSGMAA